MRFVEHSRRLGIVVSLLLTSQSALAQSPRPAPADEVTEVAPTGVITGKVINENGQPLPNVTISIRGYGSIGPGQAITSDRDGTFRSNDLDRVPYLISAATPAYTTPPRDPDSIQPIYRVGDSVTLVLVKGGVITGAVTTPEGDPVVGVKVRAQMILDGNGQPSRYGAALRERITDDRGVYRIYGLPTGSYVVMAGGGGSLWPPSDYDADAPTYAPSSTRDTAAEINVRAGEEITSVDIRYRSEPGHSVSGMATGPQTAEPSGFFINLSSTLDEGSQWNISTHQPPGDRGFVFSGIADGDYDVTARSHFQTGEWTLSEPKRIKVRGSDITGIELSTKPLAVVSGQLLLEDSRAAECKGKRRPLFAETLVFAWHNEKNKAKDQPQFIWSLGGPSSPDKQGKITLRNLAPGQYHFIPRYSAKYWYLNSISLQSSAALGPKSPRANRDVDAARNWTTLKTGDRLSGLIIKLSEGAASLQGKIKIPEGEKPPARLHVYLIPAEREKADDVLRFFAAPVLDGKIQLNNLAPGRYWIVAQAALDGPLPSLVKLRLPDETETRAKLRRDAEASKIEIEFQPCQNVTDYQLTVRSPLSVLTPRP